jgi:hypothetical protein
MVTSLIPKFKRPSCSLLLFPNSYHSSCSLITHSFTAHFINPTNFSYSHIYITHPCTILSLYLILLIMLTSPIHSQMPILFTSHIHNSYHLSCSRIITTHSFTTHFTHAINFSYSHIYITHPCTILSLYLILYVST